MGHTYLRAVLVISTVLLLAGTALAAEEPTRTEQRFMKALVAGLADGSASVRAASEEGLVMMGSKGAWYLVDQISRIKTKALEPTVRILIRIGRPALEQIELLEKRPTGRSGRAHDEVLRAFTGDGGVGGFGAPEATVAARVKEIMKTVPRNRWGSDEPALKNLVALGRPAIPALLPYLSPSYKTYGTMAGHAAESALGELCDSGDTSRLALLLDQGWLRIASVMRDIGDRNCIHSLIRCLQEGRMSHDVGTALEHFQDPISRVPLVDFLETHGTNFPSGTSSLLELAEALGATEALPAIRKILATPAKESHNRNRRKMYAAKAMALLGDSAGIPVLITLLTVPRDDRWMAPWIGNALNGVTGQSFWSEGRDGKEVRAAYEKWWHQNGSNLRWNGTSRSYEPK